MQLTFVRKAFVTGLFVLSVSQSIIAQCIPAIVRETANINTSAYPLNSAFNGSNTATATIASLSSNMFSFTGAVAGTAVWSGGVQIQNDATVGNYIYVQPITTTAATTANVATYTFQFNEAVTNLSLRCAGLNNQDQLKITAFNGATPITLTAANFSDNVADPGNAGTIVISNGSTLTGNNTAGGTSVNTNRITLTIPTAVTKIVMTSGKADNSTSTVTLGFTSVSYTRCVNAPADLNAVLVNAAVTGNVGTNDVKPTGTTYGAATAVAGNPGPAIPVVSSDGSYTFTSAITGIFKFTVPMCPGSVVAGDCPLITLIITVSNPITITNVPFANTDFAATPLNTAVVINTLANDKGGNNNGVSLNPASVTVTTAPLHGTTSVNAANGNITFTPTAGYSGTDTLTYTVCDFSSPSIKCATAKQIITILAAGSANTTVATDDYNSTALNIAVSGNVKNNDSDPEGNTQTVTAQNITNPGKGTLSLTTSGSYTFTPATGFSGPVNFPYVVCDNAATPYCTGATLYLLVFPSAILPVKMVSFTAQPAGKDAKLAWSTAEQQNLNRFEIERSPFNASSFTKAGTVAANMGTGGNYTFTDINAADHFEKGYYRVKSVYNDGRFTYSTIALVNFANTFAATLNPALVHPGEPVIIYTGNTNNSAPYTIILTNQAGQVLQRNTVSTNSNKKIETGTLPKAVYFVRIIQNAFAATQKFVVQ